MKLPAADPNGLFTPTGGEVRVFELDWAALDAFRADRMSRGFFWKAPADPTDGAP